MLIRKHCLRKEKDFQKTIRRGKKIEEEFLTLKFIKNSLFNKKRIGFIVSRKICPKASSRNKIKRRLREIIKINLPNLKSGYDLVFFAKKGISNKDFWEIKKVVEQILRKAKLISR